MAFHDDCKRRIAGEEALEQVGVGSEGLDGVSADVRFIVIEIGILTLARKGFAYAERGAGGGLVRGAGARGATEDGGFLPTSGVVRQRHDFVR